MDIFTALKKIEEIEQKASELYRHYHLIFKSDQEASFFFYKMSVEERGHRNLIQYVKMIAEQNPELFSTISFPETLFSKIYTHFENEIRRRPLPTLLQAINILEELEIDLGEAYLRNLPLKNNPILTDLYSALGEKDHIEKITAFRTKINARI